MYHFKKLTLITVLAIACFLSSCKNNEIDPNSGTDTTGAVTYSAINQWLYEIMGDAYFWYKKMPAEASLDKTISPTDYFEKLVYQRASTDRFSEVTPDIDALKAEFNGVSKIFGIGYSISFLDATKTSMGLFLNMVVKGSPAEAKGLKRGDIIVKINNSSLTSANYAALLSTSETLTFTFGAVENGKIVTSSKTATVTKALVSENPILFSTVISKPAYGKKIGYLVYTQFVPGTDADAKKYDNALRQVFAGFKTQGVNELVLDLRFNPGGYMNSANTLASLIGKNANSSKIFYKEKWNDKYTSYWTKMKGADALNYYFNDEPNNIGSGLSRLFVLISNGTASASELVINGLKPYMDVITIGENTAGKNLFGSVISDDKNRWKWGVYMMLGQTTNVNDVSDYGTVNGMTPTFVVKDNVIPFKAFADENETLFRKVLDLMGIPANEGGRLAAPVVVDRLVKETVRDDLKIREKRMIREKVLMPANR